MKKTFVALVGIHMVAGLVDDSESLRSLLKNMPTSGHWHDVRQAIQSELRRRDSTVSPRLGRGAV